MKHLGLIALTAFVPGLALADTEDHFVYTLLNQATGNAVQTYQILPNGHLQYKSQTYTGGLGTGHGLGTQSALSLSEDGRWLIAVNAGNNTVSIFFREDDHLVLTDVEPSGGVSPASVTQHDGLVYVLNQGSATVPGNIQGFARFRGGLLDIPGATADLSATGVIPVEIKFTVDGSGLVVPEKTSNLIDTFKLDFRGVPVDSNFQPSHGATPFGFDFDKQGRMFITEAFGGAVGASALSSYWLGRDLGLHLISGSVPNFQGASCWDVVSPNGKFVFTGNTGSGNVSGYKIAGDGSVSLLKASGISGVTGGSTIDTAMDSDGDYLYVLADGTQQITTFSVDDKGNLQKVDVAGDLPVGTSGLVAR